MLPGEVVEGEEQVGVGDQTAVASLAQTHNDAPPAQSQRMDPGAVAARKLIPASHLVKEAAPQVIAGPALPDRSLTPTVIQPHHGAALVQDYWRVSLPEDVYNAIADSNAADSIPEKMHRCSE